MTKAKVCRWKEGARTACPILIDNLSQDEVDDIWGEISNINWAQRTEALETLLKGPSVKQTPNKRSTNIRRMLYQ